MTVIRPENPSGDPWGPRLKPSLADFLRARIEEDETLARSAQERALTPWRATYGRQVETAHDGYLVTPEDEHSYSTDPPDEVALHIARHDPVRVLADREAKRRIVAEHSDHYSPDDPVTCDAHDGKCGVDECPTLRVLAAVYSDHPDYRDEWRP